MFLTHVGFWDNETEVPTPQYLDTLDRALSQGLNRMVVLLIATKVRLPCCTGSAVSSV